MIIQQQNFIQNFNAAVQYEDISLLFTIFSGELADLFIQREQDIFELFSQCGIKYNRVSVYEVYVDKILKGIRDGNDDLITGLAFLFCDNNNEVYEDWDTNLEGITVGILLIGEYLNENNYNYLRVQVLNAIRVRLRPNNKRKLQFEDSTVFTGIFLLGIALLFYYTFRKKPIVKQAPKTEVKPPEATNPAFNVSPDVLIPESEMPPKVETPPTPALEVKTETPKAEAPKIESVNIETPTETIKETVTPKATT